MYCGSVQSFVMLILASGSPRRAELLRNAAIEFDVQPAHIPEERLLGEHPLEYVQRLAREKAAVVLGRNPGTLVLGADTTVVVDEHVLEKPLDHEDAARMLRLLSGRTHEVMTGVCLAGQTNGGKTVCDIRSETTEVTFSAMTEEDIRWYIESGEPMDKAGAYGIQGIASRWVSRIEGTHPNVMGLPVSLVVRMLNEVNGRG